MTTAWWDDIWLNEAFASWVEAKVLVPWKPEWHYDLWRARSTARAMSSDGLVSARRIRQGILSNDDIFNAFDDITYAKGSAVIGMFEAYVGPDRFRKGVQRYLTTRAHGNATASDFLAAISADAGRDMAPAFSTFLEQPGVPLVGAELKCDGGKPRLLLSSSATSPPAPRVAAPPPGRSRSACAGAWAGRGARLHPARRAHRHAAAPRGQGLPGVVRAQRRCRGLLPLHLHGGEPERPAPRRRQALAPRAHRADP